MSKEPRESAPVRVLLASRNIETIDFLCQQTRLLSMHVETACDVASAMRKLCHSKFEGLIVDFEFGDDGLRLLGNLPGLTSNRRAISFAIVADESNAALAFRAHATFAFQRPFSIAAVARTFRAAQPMMFRERRRDYRYPIEARTFISSDDSEFLGNSVNLLPRMEEPLVVSGEVCWSDTNGRAGIQFLELPIKTLERLQLWLSERMSELVPGW